MDKIEYATIRLKWKRTFHEWGGRGWGLPNLPTRMRNHQSYTILYVDVIPDSKSPLTNYFDQVVEYFKE